MRKYWKRLTALFMAIVIVLGIPHISYAAEEFDASVSVFYSVSMNNNYTALKVETTDIPTEATGYGVEIGGEKYPYDSALLAGFYITETADLIAGTEYGAKPYYEVGAETVYAEEFRFTTAAALQSYRYNDNTYYKTATSNIAFGYNDKSAGPSGGIDVIGNNGRSWLSSTYSDSGWGVCYSTIADGYSFTELQGPMMHRVYSGKIHGWVIPEISEDGYFVTLTYYIRNVSDQPIEDYKFGTAADVKIGSNDSAPITKTDYGFELSDGSNTFALIFNDGYIDTPVSSQWFGYYGGAGSSVFNTVTSDRYTGNDSGAAFSWQNIDLAVGELQKYQVILGVGDADTLSGLIKPKSAVDFIEETLTGLEAGTNYEITCDNNVYVFTADSRGCISLSGKDQNQAEYDFIGKTISVVQHKNGETSSPQIVQIAQRPDAVMPDHPIPGDSSPELPDDLEVKTTVDSITIEAKNGQEYSIDGGQTWVRGDNNGNVIFENLTENTDYVITTRRMATEQSFVSLTATFTIRTKNLLDITDITITGSPATYDRTEKKITVSAGDAVVSYSETLNGTYGEESPGYTEVGSYPVYYKIQKEGYHDYYNVTNLEIVRILPTATIKALGSDWDTPLTNLTFDERFSEVKTVTVEYGKRDKGTELVDKLYYVADKELTPEELQQIQWKPYTQAIVLSQNGNYVIYAKVTDLSGNTVIVNTDGFVLENMPIIQEEEPEPEEEPKQEIIVSPKTGEGSMVIWFVPIFVAAGALMGTFLRRRNLVRRISDKL